jgi:hypothetical protein
MNLFGGFVVTDRMLEMFKAKKPKPAAAASDEVLFEFALPARGRAVHRRLEVPASPARARQGNSLAAFGMAWPR